MNVDPTGTFLFAFLIGLLVTVAVSAVCNAIDGGITAAMNGQDFWLGFAAGFIGGAIGGAISAFTGGSLWGSIIGRGVSTAIYGILNELFQNGSLDNLDMGMFFADIALDMLYTAVYAYPASNFGSKITNFIGGTVSKLIGDSASALLGGILDGIVDIVQTIIFSDSVRGHNGRIKKKFRRL